MLEAIEATIDPFGNVELGEKIHLDRSRRAVLTILDEDPLQPVHNEWTLAGSAVLIDDDLESASRNISDEINQALGKSAKEFLGEG